MKYAILFVSIFISQFAFAKTADEIAQEVFSTLVIKSASVKDGRFTLEMYRSEKTPAWQPDYFTTGDKANKIFAIDSARFFRNNPELKSVKITLPYAKLSCMLYIKREQIEDYYGVSFAAMHGNLERWRSDFSGIYDNRESRAKFVDRFVKCHQ